MADDDELLLRMLNQLPEPKRQPNLLFAATQYLGGLVEPPADFRDWALRHWADLATTMRTQTNEPARCATLLPVLAGLPQPLALLEVGASAGLCLYPDEYQYGLFATRWPLQVSPRIGRQTPRPRRLPWKALHWLQPGS
jgi:hypothetical protein